MADDRRHSVAEIVRHASLLHYASTRTMQRGQRNPGRRPPGTPKYVVASRPVDITAWDPTVVIAGPDLLDEVSRLKQADGGDIVTWGTGRLTDALASAGLLDEYRICTSPVIKGGGEPLFRPASTGAVELLDTKTFTTGAVVHAYSPTSAP